MCGIAGFIGNFTPALLSNFGARLAHRGPDGEGTWHQQIGGGACVGFTHRRLSIIDTTDAASQPMEAVGGRYMVVFNGEIYNYKSLVGPLVQAGYQFNKNSDTAVIAPFFHAHGQNFTDHLQGMFAFAIWDKVAEELTLVRDHAGIKPLYYTQTPQGLAFASELKALLGVPGLDDTLDAPALADYLTLLWTPGERTAMRGVKKLPPGHLLKVKLAAAGKGVETSVYRWYQPPMAPLKNGQPVYDYTKTPAQLRALFDSIVAEQCTSDVPIGAFLSGGVDSSAIVASMMATGNAPQNTYCIGFTGAGMADEGFSDDLTHAQAVAKHLGVPLTPIMADIDVMLKRLPDMAYVLDEPTADPAPLFVEDISRAARADGIKVLLGGTGGDDVFSGYRRHATARFRETLGGFGAPAGMVLGVASTFLKGANKRRASKFAELLQLNDEDFLLNAFQTNSNAKAWHVLNGDLRNELADGWRNALHTAREESKGQSLLNRLLYMELFGFLPDHNLNYNDKASMLAGVEGRVPFTDKRLLSWMADVPPENKLRKTHLKWFLKEAFKSGLPPEVMSRSKAGFGAPMRGWLAGKGASLVNDTLFSGQAGTELFDRKALQKLWADTRMGTVDGTSSILAACMLVWWLNAMNRHKAI